MNFLQQNNSLKLDIENTTRRLAQRKKAIATTTNNLLCGVRTQLTSPASFCFAGFFGYVVGEFSQRPRACETPGEEKSGETNVFGTFQSLVKLVLNVVALDSLFGFSQISEAASPDEDRSSNRF